MTPQTHAVLPPLKILIVDDEIELRELLSLKFKKSGFEVDLAATGAEAAFKLDSSNYGVVLCDLNLPDSPKGIELYRLSNNKEQKPIFIAITGYTQDSPEVRDARTAGVEHIFSKPLKLRSILDLIDRSA